MNESSRKWLRVVGMNTHKFIRIVIYPKSWDCVMNLCRIRAKFNAQQTLSRNRRSNLRMNFYVLGSFEFTPATFIIFWRLSVTFSHLRVQPAANSGMNILILCIKGYHFELVCWIWVRRFRLWWKLISRTSNGFAVKETPAYKLKRPNRHHGRG